MKRVVSEYMKFDTSVMARAKRQLINIFRLKRSLYNRDPQVKIVEILCVYIFATFFVFCT